MDAKNFGKNLEKVRKFLLKGDDEIDEKLFEELKKIVFPRLATNITKNFLFFFHNTKF